MFAAEQGIGQGPSSQPRSCSLNLEEAQHTLSSSLPLIYLRIFCCSATTLLHARYALYDHEASPKGYPMLLHLVREFLESLCERISNCKSAFHGM